ncbi:response regulator [Clostridium pasteurianum]|uniref:response regulator n=1 Tax=Clostridium pasteurianum TaxID=1501 RepID=UPI0003A8E9CE|nr:response regulator [Clostridium pasteurianum]
MDSVQSYLSDVNILIVDDCSLSVNVLIMILEQKGYNVRDTFSSELALQYARENPPDMILLKTNIPAMDGYKLCEILKSEEKLKKIPIIFIVTDNETFDKDRVFACGGADYITMPFNNKEVLARIETHLKLPFMQQRYKALENNVREKESQLEQITAEFKEFNVILEEEITERTKTEDALKESERQLRYSLELQKKQRKKEKD